MPRYFIEVAYKGTHYSGFQVQQNAKTVQSEVEQAFTTLHRAPVTLTGSSRTDAGVHAFQNFFHFDFESDINPQFVYKMNALLPADVVLRQIWRMPGGAHSRFDAVSRMYQYRLHRFKDPFSREVSFYFPYRLDMDAMQEASVFLLGQTDFSAFSKTNTQVKNFNCKIIRCGWVEEEGNLVFEIEANRFLRGMVRLLTAALLKVGRGKLGIDVFKKHFGGGERSGSSVPAHGLFLKCVNYPENYFPAPGLPFTGF